MPSLVSTPVEGASFAELCSALAALQQTGGFDDLLVSTVGLLRRAGAPAHLAACMRDPVTGLWQLAALVDAEGRSLPLEDPEPGPAASAAEAAPAESPLPELLTNPLGMEAWRRIRGLAGAATPAAVIVNGGRGTGAVLLALPLAGANAELVTAVLRHAALATERLLPASPPPGRLLEPHWFAERAAEEVARARRYERGLALLVCRYEGGVRAEMLGRTLSAQVRRWDAVGLLAADHEEVGVLLPETDRGGSLGFLNRWRGALVGARAGLALFPSDGRSPAELIGLARMRCTQVAAPAERPGARKGAQWLRGAPAGLGPETVLCPACLAAYSRAWQRQADRAVSERERRAAQEWLAAHCPGHGERIAVPAGTARETMAPELPPNAPASALIDRIRRPEQPRMRRRARSLEASA